MEEPKGIRLTEDQKKKQRARSFAIGIGIAVLVVLFYALTVFKLGPSVLNRDL
jgi:hypothetical protein